MNLNSLTIPSSVTVIGGTAFGDCYNLQEVHNQSFIPQTAFGNYTIFSGFNRQSCRLYVPSGCTSAYRNAPIWREFNIMEEETSVTINANTAVITWEPVPDAVSYTLSVYTDEAHTQLFGTYIIDVSASVQSSVMRSPANVLSYTVTDLSENAAYYYTIIPENENNEAITVLNGNFVTYTASGIFTPQTDMQLTLYPNPVNDELRIINYEFKGNETIQIVDVSGRVVLSTPSSVSPQSPMSLNVGNLSAGVYLIKIGNHTARFIKK